MPFTPDVPPLCYIMAAKMPTNHVLHFLQLRPSTLDLTETTLRLLACPVHLSGRGTAIPRRPVSLIEPQLVARGLLQPLFFSAADS